jgi:DNA-binding CsgD family transcriptional regulator/tetratricopeptide (TPR) repeat protein
LGSGAAPIGEIIPEVLGILDEVGPAPNLEPDQARFRLFEAITGFLKRASEDSPILLVLDDLHWADQPSLLLLEFIARQLDSSQILVIGTYRDNETPPESLLGESLARLARMASFQRQPLTGLPTEEVGAFIERETGFKPPEALLGAIHAHTEGNPFYLGEVVRYLADLGRLDEASIDPTVFENLGVPQGILDVIGQRLMRLSEPCNVALATAAVIGREFEFNLLETLTELAEGEDLLDLMDEAISARIIEELPGAAARYQFRHALLQQTLIENISAARKVRLHARIGEALENAYGDDPGEHIAELAHHFTQAASVLGTEQMLRYELMAGERALASHAHEEAVEHFQRGLTAKGVMLEGSEAADDAIAAELLFGLGRSQVATAAHSAEDRGKAISYLKRTFEYYRQSGQQERAVQVAQFQVRPRPGYQFGLISLVEPAVGMAPPDSPDAARLLILLGEVLGLEEGRYPEAQQAFDKALAIAESCGDVSLEMRTLSTAANVHFFHAQGQAALQASLRAIELSGYVDDPRSELIAHYTAFFCLLRSGQTLGAARHASTMVELGERVGDDLMLANGYWVSERVSTITGDWDAARVFSDSGLALSPGASVILSTRAMLEYETGESNEGSSFVKRLLDSAKSAPDLPVAAHWTVASCIPVISRVTGILDHVDEAERSAEIFLSSPQALPLLSLGVQAGLALIAVVRQDRTACREMYDLFLSQENHQNHTMSTGRLLGLLAHTIGKPDAAIDHFEDSLASCRDAGFRPELAWTCHDYSESLLKRNQPGDRERAGLLLDEGLSNATELGMTPLIARTIALQERWSSAPARRPANPGGLSQREMEVLLLISGGKTDREIGDELFISIKTVGNHVSNILNKTESANRAEAATFAALHGIVTEDGED